MNLDQARSFLVSLAQVQEAEQFGGLIYWCADKAIGGRMFAHLNIEPQERYRISFPAGQERFAELVEREGFAPAPYLARAFWVAAERWDVLCHEDWETELREAHAKTLARLAPKTRKLLALPAAELRKAIAAQRKTQLAKDLEKRK